MATKEESFGTAFSIEAFFLGKWIFDENYPHIPALELHKPKRQTYIKRKVIENTTTTISSVRTMPKTHTKSTVQAMKKTDVVLAKVTPENNIRNCKRKVNASQVSESQTNKRIKVSLTKAEERKQNCSYKENDGEFFQTRHSQRKAAKKAAAFLKEITNKLEEPSFSTPKEIHYKNNQWKEKTLIKDEKQKTRSQKEKDNRPNDRDQRQSGRKEKKQIESSKDEKEKTDKHINCDSYKDEQEKANRQIEINSKPGKNDKKKSIMKQLNAKSCKDKQEKSVRGVELDKEPVNNKRGRRVMRKQVNSESSKVEKEKLAELSKDQKSGSYGIDKGMVLRGRSKNDKSSQPQVIVDEFDVVDECDDTWKEPGKKKSVQKKIAGKRKEKEEEEYKGENKKTRSTLGRKKHTETKTEAGKTTKVPKKSKPSKKDNSKEKENDTIRPEDVVISAKKGTFRYLQQREEYVKAVAKEAEVDTDFFSNDKAFTKKKNCVSDLVFPSSHDDTFTIKTPLNKGKNVPDKIITPRTALLGQLQAVTPSTDAFTPVTSSPAHESKSPYRKDVLQVMFHQMQGKKERQKGIRKSLQDREMAFSSTAEKSRKFPLLELPTFPEAPDDIENDSSLDDYFNISNVL